MKVALTVWNNRIAPVCDVAGQILELTIENGRAAGRPGGGSIPCPVPVRPGNPGSSWNPARECWSAAPSPVR